MSTLMSAVCLIGVQEMTGFLPQVEGPVDFRSGIQDEGGRGKGSVAFQC